MISQKKFPKSYCYVVGVSGGPDSIFCLDNMRKFGYNVVVAHVNYRKRSSSDDDENIVRSYCHKYSLPFVVRLVNKEEYAFHIGNFQAWARSIRYNFFKEIALKYKTEHIMVAHQYDDLLETYLLQKNRKSLVNY
jgi:tRNA(Ile)-lysidine synthase